jgi:hypothetical protein
MSADPPCRRTCRYGAKIYQQLSGHRRTATPQAAPFFPCHTRFVPQRSQMSNLFIVAPQCWHEYLRLPPFAVFSMRLPHSGHAFWSCLMGFDELRVVSGNAITHCEVFFNDRLPS